MTTPALTRKLLAILAVFVLLVGLGAFALALREEMTDGDDEGGNVAARGEPPNEGSQAV